MEIKHWSVDTKKFAQYPGEYRRWQLEQRINFGIGKKKIKEKELRKFWPQIKDRLNPYKKRYLEYLLWQKASSLPDNLNFWDLSAKKKQ